jgi:hypothetical protein
MKNKFLICKKDYSNAFLFMKPISFKKNEAYFVFDSLKTKVGIIHFLTAKDSDGGFLRGYYFYETFVGRPEEAGYPYIWDHFYTTKQLRKDKLNKIDNI